MHKRTTDTNKHSQTTLEFPVLVIALPLAAGTRARLQLHQDRLRTRSGLHRDDRAISVMLQHVPEVGTALVSASSWYLVR
jgi:hypothetical protein